MRSALAHARYRSDEIFNLITPDALYSRPIPERHRFVFYLGHLEAFDSNLIGPSFGRHEEFDRLFAFGIDPTNGGLPTDQPEDWPRELQIRSYCGVVRDAIDFSLYETDDFLLFHVAIEHRLMHAETLAYMLHWLPLTQKKSRPVSIDVDPRPVQHSTIAIPAGCVTLGALRGSIPFGWDNEFEANAVEVPAFAIDKYKVTNAQFKEFVDAGGYREKSLWSERAWEWIRSADVRHPKFWLRAGETFRILTMFAEVPFQPGWPVYVSQAEAQAYARWKGKALPSEAQFHRAAYGGAEGGERVYPWGSDSPLPRHGNFNFQRWDPMRVDVHPAGDSAFGVSGLVGNGWEWTSTVFAPFPGFERFAFYPGYSADFFDGNHYVMKGGSARTAAALLRPSFRNWFQPLYPNIYTGFRCVEN